MLFHSKVAVLTFMGSSAGWKSQNRADRAVPLKEALRFHGGGMLLALIWAALLIKSNPSFAWWLSPIWVSLLLAPFSTSVSSSPSLGRALMRLGLWRTPLETRKPDEISRVEELTNRPGLAKPAFPGQRGFERAAVEPAVNSLHISLLKANRKLEPAIRLRRRMLMARLIDHGPDALNDKEKIEILSDPALMTELHQSLWAAPEQKLNRWLSAS
jgi:membrane glycosyltransferase